MQIYSSTKLFIRGFCLLEISAGKDCKVLYILSVARRQLLPESFWLLLIMWCLSKNYTDFTSHAEHTSATVGSLRRKSWHSCTATPSPRIYCGLYFDCGDDERQKGEGVSASTPWSALQKISSSFSLDLKKKTCLPTQSESFDCQGSFNTNHLFIDTIERSLHCDFFPELNYLQILDYSQAYR